MPLDVWLRLQASAFLTSTSYSPLHLYKPNGAADCALNPTCRPLFSPSADLDVPAAAAAAKKNTVLPKPQWRFEHHPKSRALQIQSLIEHSTFIFGIILPDPIIAPKRIATTTSVEPTWHTLTEFHIAIERFVHLRAPPHCAQDSASDGAICDEQTGAKRLDST